MKKLFYFLIFVFLSARIQAQCGTSDVGGTAYLELPAHGANANTYGIKDSNEPGVDNINVNVFDSQDNQYSTTTDSEGNWSIAAPSFPVRVEFSWSQNWLQASHGAANSSTRFVDAATCDLNFGLLDPNDYSATPTPDYVSNLKIAGDASNLTNTALQTIGYQAYGLNSNYNTSQGDPGTGPIPVDDATIDEIGSNWAKTLQKSNQRMFLPAVLWRHASFAAGTGLSNIFVMDYSGATAQLVGNFDLQGVTPINGGSDIDFGAVCRAAACANDAENTGIAGDYEITNSTNNIDLDAFKKVAKVGFGGIDMDNNTETLWAINLYQKAILKIDASGDLASMTNNVSQFLIESIPGMPSVVGGELRPWAITVYRGKGYIGLVNDGITSQDINDMNAYILSFDLDDPMAGFTTEQTIALNYDKDGDDWHPWLQAFTPDDNGFWQYYTQPVLSDIDFDELGNMYLAFMDRFGLQTGFFQSTPVSANSESDDEHHRTKGEILKLCNNAGSYELEGTGSCPTNGTEFFDDISGDGQPDGSNGALAILPGTNQLLLQAMDPHPSGQTGEDYWTSHGTNTMNTITGAIEGYYTYVLAEKPFSGKGLGMGDIEFLTDHAPMQVTNRVWDDANGNGIQDPDEGGLENVEVSIVFDGNVIATATTDNNGLVLFSSDPYTTSTSSQKFNLPLSAKQAYTFEIANLEGDTQQTALAGKTLSEANTGEGSNSDANDSDAIIDDNTAIISVSNAEVPVYGATLYAKDFGFAPASTLPIDILEPLKAKHVQNFVELDWTTSQEINNQGFEVQKSNNGNVWESFAWLDGLGTDQVGKHYSVNDYDPNSGINYYRYIQVDYDGKETTSPIVNVYFGNDTSVNLYPNPSNKTIYLQQSTNTAKPMQYAIFTLLGEQITNGITTNNQINMVEIPKGLYFIQLTNENGFVQTFRQLHQPR